SWYFRNALVRANYRNLEKGIGYEPMFLVRFFRNLLLGENNTLKNRYMIINPPEEWKMPESEQTPDKYRTSTGQVQDKFFTDNYNIIEIIKVIANNQLSVKEMMAGLNLKGRDNFLNLYLSPAIAEGYVRLLYPKSPRHPRQKYLLTVKGLALYNELTKGE
ncbi:MAG: cell filamentation protein Fic, partial [Bacteroidales bacterium]|nr:cell filamentation protein Fic [Bacteroidales bacterium]